MCLAIMWSRPRGNTTTPCLCFPLFEGWGNNGVDIFFVISGFVMVYTQSNNPRSAFSFFSNRILRIVPTYWLLSVAVVVLFVLIPSTFRGLKLTGAYSLTSLFFVSRIFGYDYPIIYVGWTLEYEMPFYALFAAGFSSRTNELPLLFQ